MQRLHPPTLLPTGKRSIEAVRFAVRARARAPRNLIFAGHRAQGHWSASRTWRVAVGQAQQLCTEPRANQNPGATPTPPLARNALVALADCGGRILGPCSETSTMSRWVETPDALGAFDGPYQAE
jgi:hypothetical protein